MIISKVIISKYCVMYQEIREEKKKSSFIKPQPVFLQLVRSGMQVPIRMPRAPLVAPIPPPNAATVAGQTAVQQVFTFLLLLLYDL